MSRFDVVFQPLLAVGFVTSLIACGPAARTNTGGPGDGVDAASTPDSGPCVPAAEQCSGGVDEDCDGLVDCSDPDCSGVGTCPVCGTVSHPLATPLALPDGDGAFYTSKLHFTGFGATQKVTDVHNLLSVCVNMEHSWLRDLQIELIAPSGETVVLQKMLGRTGGEVFMGMPNDNDGTNPVPGVGANYCWTPTATKPPMLDYVNAVAPSGHFDLPPSNYQASGTFSPIMGASLNGDWTIKVTDLWPIDNGFIFEWNIAFDPTLVQDCSGPIIQ
jgi:hypothetical protein